MTLSEKYLSYSLSESEITGLKIGRSDLIDLLDEKQLHHEIIKGKFDFLRIKILSDDVNLFHKLQGLNIPFHIYNIQRRYIKLIDKKDTGLKISPEINYEIITQKHKKVLKKLLAETIKKDSGLNYHNHLFSALFPEKKLFDAAQEYANTFIQPNNENKIGWVIKVKNQYAGFCICRYEKEEMEGLLYGVAYPFQGKGYSRDLIRIVKKFCSFNQLRTLRNNVVIQNVKSLKSMVNEGFLPEKIYFNVFLFPLLSFNRKE